MYVLHRAADRQYWYRYGDRACTHTSIVNGCHDLPAACLQVLNEYKKLFDDMDGFIQGYIWPLVQAKQKTHVDFRQHLGRLRRQVAEDEAAAAAAAKVASS